MLQKVSDQEHRQLASVALQFASRMQISGGEADNFVAVRNWLTMIANGNLVVSQLTPIPPPGAPEKPSLPQPPAPPAGAKGKK